MSTTSIAQALDRFIGFFEQLKPSDLSTLGEYYAADAHFKDPFNEVQGLEEIQRIFIHMFDTLDAPHFIVTERIMQDQQCFLVWEFRFRFKRSKSLHWEIIRGGTHLKFDSACRVVDHRDYWDAAEELYEKLPILGALMRWLKRQINH